jgi:hypothetical protein
LHKWIRHYIIQIIYLQSYVSQSPKKNTLSYKFTALVIIKYQQSTRHSEEESKIDISNLTSEIYVEQNSQLDTELDIELLISLIDNIPILRDKTFDKFSDEKTSMKNEYLHYKGPKIYKY